VAIALGSNDRTFGDLLPELIAPKVGDVTPYRPIDKLATLALYRYRINQPDRLLRQRDIDTSVHSHQPSVRSPQYTLGMRFTALIRVS